MRAQEKERGARKQASDNHLLVALPERGRSMTQDAEWCVVRVNGEWRQIRFHDYDQLFAVPGLYERVIYDILRCDSPAKVRGLLEEELVATATPAEHLRVLDLGAGNGMVGEQLTDMGVELVVGVDIIKAAADATERDRPGIYTDYHVLDMTRLNHNQQRRLAGYEFNCLTCVAALGFGDIPPSAFMTAYNLITTGGWVAFNIKEDFLKDRDASGFARLIQAMIAHQTVKVQKQERYPHRLSTDRKPIHYVAFVGKKRRSIEEAVLDG